MYTYVISSGGQNSGNTKTLIVPYVSDCPCERIGKWETWPIRWCAFSWSICDISTTLLGVSRVTVSKVISIYTNHGKISAKRNNGRKSTLTERDRRTLRRIVSKNHRSTAAQVTARSVSDVSFTLGLQLLNL
jgi:hypothetical protein